MSMIPGLDPIPIGNKTAPTGEEIKFIDLKGNEFIVPEAHRYGTCRLETEFKKIDNIGEGAYGKVYKAKDLKRDEIVAMKRLKATSKSEGLALRLLREVNILKNLSHENIVNLRDIASGRELDQVFLIMEYCKYELANVLDSLILLRQSIEVPKVKCIMQQLCSGLKHLHLHHVLHRDIKVSNILFTENGCLKIGDFGLSRLFSEGSLTPGLVSLWYRAPEILFQSEKYTSAVDVWSAGCIFAELLNSKQLFAGKNEMEVITQIMSVLGVPNEIVWPGCSELPVLKMYDLNSEKECRLSSIFEKETANCKDLIKRIFLYNPVTRISAKQCLKHPYFKDEPVACDRVELAKFLADSEVADKNF